VASASCSSFESLCEKCSGLREVFSSETAFLPWTVPGFDWKGTRVLRSPFLRLFETRRSGSRQALGTPHSRSDLSLPFCYPLPYPRPLLLGLPLRHALRGLRQSQRRATCGVPLYSLLLGLPTVFFRVLFADSHPDTSSPSL